MWQTEEDTIEQPIQTVTHPWIRFLARMLDLNAYTLLWTAFAQLILRFNSGNLKLGNLLDSFIAFGIMLLLEPLLLSTWGTTPGKWVFGLVVRDSEGNKLDYRKAAARTWGVIGSGCGYNIPFYNLYCFYKSYRKCSDFKPLPWEEDGSYSIKDTKSYRAVLYVAAFIIMVFIAYVINLQVLMPMNRGDITSAEYAENCNEFIRYSGLKLNRTMNEHTIITEGDKVKGIKIEVETSEDTLIDGYVSQKLIAVMGFLAAQPEMNCFKLRSSKVLNQIQKPFENYTDYEAGVRIKNEVEYTGYDLANDNFLFPNQEEEQYFHMIFTLEKVN